MKQYSKWTRSTLSVFAALALVGVVGCGGDDATSAVEEEVVVLGPRDVQPVQRGEVNATVVLTGSLNPYRIVEVRAQVPGTLANLRVDEGDPVRQGQVMATIEAEGIRSQAAGARAGAAAAEANLALARQQLESARMLYEAGAMSEIDFRTAQAAYEAAQAQLAAARAQAAGAGETASRATITAPISGEVSEREANQGEAVSPGQSLFTVVNSQILELQGQIPVEQAAHVRPGQPVEFTVDAYPGQVFRGEVARVDPTADPATRQIGIYMRLPNQERGLVGGLFATGRIMLESNQTAILVPTAAIRQTGAQSYVWVVEDGRIVRQEVTLGARDETRGVIAVTGGLSGGERVVVAPGELTEGTQVRISTEATTDSTGEGG
ncbi:MAG TPA: efflux RND transporter periplasmic adaptor subunit [Longimicrobiaceae bacterium]|nr:efflux RND transporter periplasmic adaptor subunit [Longimicrobiaceae bacterium]